LLNGSISLVNLDVPELVVFLSGGELLGVTLLVLRDQVEPEDECEGHVGEDGAKDDDPGDGVPGAVFLFPELGVEHLADGVADEEDSVASHFLGVTREDHSAEGEDHDHSHSVHVEQVDLNDESDLVGEREGKADDASDDTGDEAENAKDRSGIVVAAEEQATNADRDDLSKARGDVEKRGLSGVESQS